jgi:hypothetical protein
MSTRAQIAIQIGPEEWAHTYVLCGCRPVCKKNLTFKAGDRVRFSVRPSYAAFAGAAGQYGDQRSGSKFITRA